MPPEGNSHILVSGTIEVRILYCAYEMKSTLTFACRREFPRDELITEFLTHSQVIANMEGSRFRRPKNADKEAAWLQETTPQNTRNSTKWSLKIFGKLCAQCFKLVSSWPS